MDTKTIGTGVISFLIGGALVLSSSSVNSETYEKSSETEMKVSSAVVTTLSLSNLIESRDNAVNARQVEADRSTARLHEFDVLISDLNAKIAKAEQLGVKEEAATKTNP